MNIPSTKSISNQKHHLVIGFVTFVLMVVLGDYIMLIDAFPKPEIYRGEVSLQNSRHLLDSAKIEKKRFLLPQVEQKRTLLPNKSPFFKVKQRLIYSLYQRVKNFYEQAGCYVRGMALVFSLLLLFIQKAPQRRVGEPRRKPFQKDGRKIVYLLSTCVFLLCSYVLFHITHYSIPLLTYAYPLSLLGVMASTFLSGMVRAQSRSPRFGLRVSRKRMGSANGFSLPTQDGGYINVPNAFRGTLVLGGAGAGKSFSIGEPIIEQFAEKNFAGIIYDFKFPVLVEVAQQARAVAALKRETASNTAPQDRHGPEVQLHIINFKDLKRTERINPLRAQDMPVMAYAEEYSRTIIHNLNTHTLRNSGEFFSSSAIAYLTGIIWFYRKNYPRYCTIPHVVATALYKDFRHVLSMLDTDVECGDMVRSLITAVEAKADKQIAGVVATLQIILTRINSPELVWVLTPDEENGEGFSLNLNDPEQPKLLCIGNDPTLKDTFSPVISCMIAVALKLMNQPGKHPSYVLLDEAATLYVPGLEVIPATARSNKIATVYMSQDLSQMIDSYGREKTQVMVSNLNNWFIGKVNNVETAELISKIVGREEKEMVSLSAGNSTTGQGHHNQSHTRSVSFQERNLVRIQDAITLEQGEFIGQTVEADSPFFQGFISREQTNRERMVLEPFVYFTDRNQLVHDTDLQSAVVQANFHKVRREVKDTVELYPNTLALRKE